MNNNQIFKSFDVKSFELSGTLEEMLLVEDLGIDGIDDALEYAIENTKEAAEYELQEKLESATFPRYGFTTAEKFENVEEYEVWLQEVLNEEYEDFKNDLKAAAVGIIETDQKNKVLESVITAAEAAQVFGLAEATVRAAINRGTLPARKSAGTWLVLVRDCKKMWGDKK